jgi:hypothetical protein
MDFRSKIHLLTQTGLQSHLKDSNVLRDLAKPPQRARPEETSKQLQESNSKLGLITQLAAENARGSTLTLKSKRPLTGTKSKPVISLQQMISPRS